MHRFGQNEHNHIIGVNKLVVDLGGSGMRTVLAFLLVIGPLAGRPVQRSDREGPNALQAPYSSDVADKKNRLCSPRATMRPVQGSEVSSPECQETAIRNCAAPSRSRTLTEIEFGGKTYEYNFHR